MSHTLKCDQGTTIFHDGDYQGAVRIVTASGQGFYVPSADLFQYVAEALRTEQISRYEQYDWQNFVGGFGRDHFHDTIKRQQV